MQDTSSPVILWLRRDLRLSDHPAFCAAAQSGRTTLPVFICDPLVDSLGTAPKWRLGLSLDAFGATLQAKGSRLILRRGDAGAQLQKLIAETGAGAVYWSRLYDPDSVARDTAIKTVLKQQGIEARSFGGHLMFEPWSVETKTGGYYKVFTPLWKSVMHRDVDRPLPEPRDLRAPDTWPASDSLQDWALGQGMRRGAAIVEPHQRVGEAAAMARLDHFIDESVQDYVANRDRPSVDGTSGLSENLALGEISPHRCWHAGLRARDAGAAGAETFMKELVWREFAYHLMHHTPHILTGNWKPDWDHFPWNTDETKPEVLAWKQGRTGIRFVDAAMRELYVTGKMHNRGRMIVASYLTKHLMCHWQIGKRWFEQCLTDWDPASNAMGWQWSAGSGPDATPYFRVFNPVSQLDKFDPNHDYASRWIAEDKANPDPAALSYFEAIPSAWRLSATDRYPAPIVAADVGRKRALEAYGSRNF
ncbi:MAG: deoxyribodipyrimidine photo-lyase [Sedimentitalea sp.]